MRVILDANVLISALLAWERQRGLEMSVTLAGIAGAYRLVLPQELIDETRSSLINRPHLRKVVTRSDVDAFIDLLIRSGEALPALTESPPRVCRDRRDDYLIAQALAGKVDCLVSGDRDVLALASFPSPFQMLSTRAFASLLDQAEAESS